MPGTALFFKILLLQNTFHPFGAIESKIADYNYITNFHGLLAIDGLLWFVN